VSLAITSAITALGGMLGGALPPVVMQALNFLVSLVILAVLFAAIFKVLPDAEVRWNDVWVGGAFTAVLFVVGKFVIGLYLGHSKPGDAFGAAGALAVILVWAYYSGMIILLGAEFTQEWAAEHGHAIEPEDGAVRADVADREAAGERATGDEKSAGRPASRRPAAARRGGVGDWIIGLPVLVLLFRRRNER
jgi:membrane protein